jgi:hypothetical protein
MHESGESTSFAEKSSKKSVLSAVIFKNTGFWSLMIRG